MFKTSDIKGQGALTNSTNSFKANPKRGSQHWPAGGDRGGAFSALEAGGGGWGRRPGGGGGGGRRVETRKSFLSTQRWSHRRLGL